MSAFWRGDLVLPGPAWTPKVGHLRPGVIRISTRPVEGPVLTRTLSMDFRGHTRQWGKAAGTSLTRIAPQTRDP